MKLIWAFILHLVNTEIQLMWKKDKVSSRSIKILVKDENIAEAHYIYVFVI